VQDIAERICYLEGFLGSRGPLEEEPSQEEEAGDIQGADVVVGAGICARVCCYHTVYELLLAMLLDQPMQSCWVLSCVI
jgi:hypothetical protein